MARPIKNNADYFPHDADMRNDPRIKAIRRKFGQLEGYAIYSMLIEYLADSDYFKIQINDLQYELIAGDFGIDDSNKVKEFVQYAVTLDLFQIDSGFLVCRSLINRMDGLIVKRKRDNMRVKFKDHVLERDGYKCLKCGSKENLTIDHIIPVAKGGIDEMDNLQTLCKTCNFKKKTNIADYRSENTQSKVEKSKVKESKEEEMRGEEKNIAWFEKQFDEIFIEQMQMTHKGKDIQQAIKESFAHLGADKLRLANADSSDCKKLLNTWLSKQFVKPETKKGFSKQDIFG